jgi:hypothetical protein
MTFKECVVHCAGNGELVSEFNRLSGRQMGKPRTGTEIAIDKACGRDPDKEAFPEFIQFVEEHIWNPLMLKTIKD